MYSDMLQLAAVKGHMGIGSLRFYLTEWLWVLAHKGMAKNERVRDVH
jgi:hypothetical protein